MNNKAAGIKKKKRKRACAQNKIDVFKSENPDIRNSENPK